MWNEFHEGTEIAESKDAKSVSVALAAKNREQGLRQIECEDGVTVETTAAGRVARQVRPFRNSARYLYFSADESFKGADPMEATLQATYFDGQRGRLHVEFVGSDANAPFAVALAGDKTGRRRGLNCLGRACSIRKTAARIFGWWPRVVN